MISLIKNLVSFKNKTEKDCCKIKIEDVQKDIK